MVAAGRPARPPNPNRPPGPHGYLIAPAVKPATKPVEVQGLELSPAPLKPTVGLGDDGLILAFPWGRRLTVVSGIISQLAPEEGRFPLEGVPRMVDASVSYGSSGGGVFDAVSGALIAIVEGYRTAKVALPETPDRALEIPVAGETTVIPARSIREFVVASGLEPYLAP